MGCDQCGREVDRIEGTELGRCQRRCGIEQASSQRDEIDSRQHGMRILDRSAATYDGVQQLRTGNRGGNPVVPREARQVLRQRG